MFREELSLGCEGKFMLSSVKVVPVLCPRKQWQRTRESPASQTPQPHVVQKKLRREDCRHENRLGHGVSPCSISLSRGEGKREDPAKHIPLPSPPPRLERKWKQLLRMSLE